MIGKLVDFVGSLWVLITLAWVSRFRFGGRYWAWRTMTAFPDGAPPDAKAGLIRSGLEYARWAWRIRRLR